MVEAPQLIHDTIDPVKVDTVRLVDGELNAVYSINARYKFKRKIADTHNQGEGVVFAVEDTKSDILQVCKMTRVRTDKDHSSTGLREWTLLSSINHPLIIPAYNYLEQDIEVRNNDGSTTKKPFGFLFEKDLSEIENDSSSHFRDNTLTVVECLGRIEDICSIAQYLLDKGLRIRDFGASRHIKFDSDSGHIIMFDFDAFDVGHWADPKLISLLGKDNSLDKDNVLNYYLNRIWIYYVEKLLYDRDDLIQGDVIHKIAQNLDWDFEIEGLTPIGIKNRLGLGQKGRAIYETLRSTSSKLDQKSYQSIAALKEDIFASLKVVQQFS